MSEERDPILVVDPFNQTPHPVRCDMCGEKWAVWDLEGCTGTTSFYCDDCLDIAQEEDGIGCI